jgi:hypothetical protein
MLSVEVVIASEAKQSISQLEAIWIDDREAASPIKAET